MDGGFTVEPHNGPSDNTQHRLPSENSSASFQEGQAGRKRTDAGDEASAQARAKRQQTHQMDSGQQQQEAARPGHQQDTQQQGQFQQVLDRATQLEALLKERDVELIRLRTLVQSRESQATTSAAASAISDQELKQEYCNSVQALKDYIAMSNLLSYDYTGKNLPDNITAELKTMIHQISKVCLQIIKPETPYVVELIAKDYTQATQQDWELDKSHWINVIALLQLTDHQVITILRAREQHIARMVALFQERALLTRQAVDMSSKLAAAASSSTSGGALAGGDGGLTVLTRHGYLYCARHMVSLHKVVELLKDNLTREQKTVMELFLKIVYQVLSPVQAALFVVEAFPYHCDALALANVLAMVFGKEQVALPPPLGAAGAVPTPSQQQQQQQPANGAGLGGGASMTGPQSGSGLGPGMGGSLGPGAGGGGMAGPMGSMPMPAGGPGSGHMPMPGLGVSSMQGGPASVGMHGNGASGHQQQLLPSGGPSIGGGMGLGQLHRSPGIAGVGSEVGSIVGMGGHGGTPGASSRGGMGGTLPGSNSAAADSDVMASWMEMQRRAPGSMAGGMGQGGDMGHGPGMMTDMDRYSKGYLDPTKGMPTMGGMPFAGGSGRSGAGGLHGASNQQHVMGPGDGGGGGASLMPQAQQLMLNAGTPGGSHGHGSMQGMMSAMSPPMSGMIPVPGDLGTSASYGGMGMEPGVNNSNMMSAMGPPGTMRNTGGAWAHPNKASMGGASGVDNMSVRDMGMDLGGLSSMGASLAPMGAGGMLSCGVDANPDMAHVDAQRQQHSGTRLASL